MKEVQIYWQALGDIAKWTRDSIVEPTLCNARNSSEVVSISVVVKPLEVDTIASRQATFNLAQFSRQKQYRGSNL